MADPELNALYPDKFPARVAVTAYDDRHFTATPDFPKEEPQDPFSGATRFSARVKAVPAGK